MGRWRFFVLLLLVLSGVVFGSVQLLRSPYGMHYLLKQAVRISANDYSILVRFGSISGDLFSDFTIEAIEIEDENGNCVAIPHLTVSWSPLEVLRLDDWQAFLSKVEFSLPFFSVNHNQFHGSNHKNDEGGADLIIKSEDLALSFKLVTGMLSQPLFNLVGTYQPLREQGIYDEVSLYATVIKTDAREGLELKGSIAFSHNQEYVLSSELFLEIGKGNSLKGELSLDGRIDELQKLLLPSDQELQGKILGSFTATGSLYSPEIYGSVYLQDASYTNTLSCTKLDNLRAGLVCDGRVVHCELGAETPGGGTVFVESSFDGTDFASFEGIKIHLEQAKLIDRSELEGVVSGELLATLLDAGFQISGALETGLIVIEEPEQVGLAIPELTVVETEPSQQQDLASRFAKVVLRIEVSVPGRLYVKGRGLEAELKGDLLLEGTLSEPLASGSLEFIRSRLDFLGQKFNIREGEISLLGRDVTGRLMADVQTPQMLATISIHATKEKVDLNLTSDPSYPSDEILARLLFREGSAKLNAVQAIQLASAMQQLRGSSSGYNPLGYARKWLGLDSLEFGSSGSGIQMATGAYLSERIFLQLDAATDKPGIGARMEIQLTPKLSLVTSQTADDEPGNISLTWKVDY